MAVVEKLQRVQNACARVILIRSKRYHVDQAHALGAALASLLSVASRSRPYFSPLNAAMVLHLHTYQHFSLPIARHAGCGLLTSYYLISPLPELKLANDPSLVQLQGHGTNYPLLCDNVRV